MRIREILYEVRLSKESVEQLKWPQVFDQNIPIKKKLLKIIANDNTLNRPAPQSDEFELVDIQKINSILAHLGDWARDSSDNFSQVVMGRSPKESLYRFNELADQYFAQKVKKANINDISGAEPVMQLSNDFKWMKLTSEEALNREGKLMGHCVGSYFELVKGNLTQIYSLWDGSNQPHCTIEIKNNQIVQIKGKQNRAVVEKYWPYVQQFVFNSNLKIKDEHEMKNIGLIFVKNKWMDFRYLPDDLYIGDDLYLDDTPITYLPRGLRVVGTLNLAGTPITQLPDDLRVGGDLDLGDTPITQLPNYLKFVAGSLNLRRSKITHLPDDLRVGGDLDLSETKITDLPDNLRVGGSLYLNGTPIARLPRNLRVDSDLDLRGTKITDLPDNLRVGGSLHLSGTPITQLPRNLRVGGGLDLSGTSITQLPDDLYVGGNLYLVNTKITDLPPNLLRVGKVFTRYSV